jgi:hypothetical protein
MKDRVRSYSVILSRRSAAKELAIESVGCVTQSRVFGPEVAWIAGEGSLASCGARGDKLEKCDSASGRG